MLRLLLTLLMTTAALPAQSAGKYGIRAGTPGLAFLDESPFRSSWWTLEQYWGRRWLHRDLRVHERFGASWLPAEGRSFLDLDLALDADAPLGSIGRARVGATPRATITWQDFRPPACSLQPWLDVTGLLTLNAWHPDFLVPTISQHYEGPGLSLQAVWTKDLAGSRVQSLQATASAPWQVGLPGHVLEAGPDLKLYWYHMGGPEDWAVGRVPGIRLFISREPRISEAFQHPEERPGHGLWYDAELHGGYRAVRRSYAPGKVSDYEALLGAARLRWFVGAGAGFWVEHRLNFDWERDLDYPVPDRFEVDVDVGTSHVLPLGPGFLVSRLAIDLPEFDDWRWQDFRLGLNVGWAAALVANPGTSVEPWLDQRP